MVGYSGGYLSHASAMIHRRTILDNPFQSELGKGWGNCQPMLLESEGL